MAVFETVFGNFDLQRFPARPRDMLQAWNAADAYVLDHLNSEGLPDDARVLLIQEEWSALAAVLARWRPVSWNDSWLAHRALQENLQRNRQSAGGPERIASDWVASHETPTGSFHIVVLKPPKSLAFFEDLLVRLRPLLTADSRVITAGMIKHTPGQVYQLLERIIGPTRTSRGWKKARLAFSKPDLDIELPKKAPDSTYRVDSDELDLANAPGVFSREKLDRGTALLLETLPDSLPRSCGDLGCGNGVIALVLARRNPEARVFGVDTSWRAVACARENGLANGLGAGRVRFLVGDGFEDSEDPDLDLAGQLDLVVSNPPFHQGRTVGDSVAWNLFHQARRALRSGGEFLVVGNRHLGYHVKLRRIFGNCRTAASDRRFVVLSSIKG